MKTINFIPEDYDKIYEQQKKEVDRIRAKVKPNKKISAEWDRNGNRYQDSVEPYHIHPSLPILDISLISLLIISLLYTFLVSPWMYIAGVITLTLLSIPFILLPPIVESNVIRLPISLWVWYRMVDKMYPYPEKSKDQPVIIKAVLSERVTRLKFEKESLQEKITTSFKKVSKAFDNVLEAQRMNEKDPNSEFYQVRDVAITKALRLLKEDLETINRQAEQVKEDYKIIESETEQLTNFYEDQFKIKAITDAFLTSEEFRVENELLQKRLLSFATSCNELTTKFKTLELEVKSRGLAELEIRA